MKKLLIGIITFFSISMLNAEINWADKLIEFKKISKKHKMEWFDFTKKWDLKLIELKKKHKENWFDYGINKTENLREATFATQTAKAPLFEKNLKAALEIRKQHGDDYNTYYTDYYNEGQKIHKKHKDEIASFEKSLTEKLDDKKDQQENNDDDDDEQEDTDDDDNDSD